MTPHPYRNIADYRHWRRAPGVADPALLDPVVNPKFAIAPDEPVASAGSCFAQHVMRHIASAGFNALISETAPSILPEDLAKAHHYGVFTTRSGNIYTARQLRQLFDRANGIFEPVAEPWATEAGVLDPFRPSIGPFASAEELAADRAWHLARVRAMMAGLSVFVFTLGLTEAWMDDDGAVFPLAPGVVGGTFDAGRHRFHNFCPEETAADLAAAIASVRAVNAEAKIILTVSPVPLMATALDRHVLTATVHSKSILRVAAQAVADADPAIDYFPSYEIITAPQTRGRYFGPDARAVSEEGVAHAMRVFLKHYSDRTAAAAATPHAIENEAFRARSQHIVDAFCDEEALDTQDR
ncbi:MAG: GSCFA domain-containing protein [Pseudomonadota bacterium]